MLKDLFNCYRDVEVEEEVVLPNGIRYNHLIYIHISTFTYTKKSESGRNKLYDAGTMR